MAITQIGHDAGTSTEIEAMTVLASAARTKGDIVLVVMTENGFVDETYASAAAVRQCAGVWLNSCASGSRGLVCIKGPVEATVTSGTFTAGNGIEMDGANIEDSGGAYAGDVGEAATDFAVAMETEAVATTSTQICLRGGVFTSTT